MRRTSLKTASVAIVVAAAFAVVPARPWSVLAQGPAPAAAPAPAPATGVRFAQLSQTDAQEWLTYLASDLLQGRQVFTEGYGLAAAYIAGHLKTWGLKPLGDDGTYFQTVKRRGYRVTRNSSVTVTVKGQSRTFRHGDHVTFPIQSGGNQKLSFTNVEFAGYGVVALSGSTPHNDFAGRDVKNKLVVWLPGTPASVSSGGRGGRGGLGGNRASYIVQTLGAAAVLGFAPAPAAATPADEALAQAQTALTEAQQAVASAQAQVRGSGRGRRGGAAGARGGRGGQTGGADFSTVLNVDNVTPPQITADEEFHRFLFSAAPTTFDDLLARAGKGEPLAPFTLDNVSVTIQVDNTYDVVSTELTKNVVGMVEGTDPQLRSTYVMFGAHLDHVGYQQSPGGRSGAPAGGGEPDLIFTGADDDGSGSTAVLGIAKAFATGPRPRRSVVFVWHAGEEAGLLGSRYFADFPPVPLEHVQAQFNIDMIGRNRDDDTGQASTVFIIGADRISTDLHNLVVATNAGLRQPLAIDFEYNDPSDPNSFYTRSDHYSYAVKGIPVAFFFTGTHPDYHGAGDHVDKIIFPKLVRIAQMIYQTGFAVANTDRVLERDNRGPRAGRGFSGPLAK
jgi:hypothetical protein